MDLNRALVHGEPRNMCIDIGIMPVAPLVDVTMTSYHLVQAGKEAYRARRDAERRLVNELLPASRLKFERL